MRETRRERGFTLIEIMVVMTIIAGLMGLVVALVPVVMRKSDETVCKSNLSQIGGLLAGKQTGGTLKRYSGAAFVLQVANQVKDDDLSIFTCPGEAASPGSPRPASGSAAFVALYRQEMDLAAGKFDDRHSSYAGPNFKDHPVAHAGREGQKTRLWACDKCRGGHPHHDGIIVLYDSSKVGQIAVEDLAGHDGGENRITVGPDSPDPRLKSMTFFPPQ